MDKYIVSLEVASTKHTLSEITEALGVAPASECPEKGKPLPMAFASLQKRFSRTCWRLESGSRPTVSVKRQLQRLISKLPRRLPEVVKQLQAEAFITIGVFTDRPMRTVDLDAESLYRIGRLGCRMTVTFYRTTYETAISIKHRSM